MLRLRAPNPAEFVNSRLLQAFLERLFRKTGFGVTAMLSHEAQTRASPAILHRLNATPRHTFIRAWHSS